MITVKAAEFLVKFRVWKLEEFQKWAVEWCEYHKVPYHEVAYDMLYSHFRRNYENTESYL